MNTSTEPQAGTIHGIAHSIVALPYQLGYHPTASLVLLCMGPGPPVPVKSGSERMRGSVTLIARVDLDLSSARSPSVEGLEPAFRRGDVASVVALAFEDGCAEEFNAVSTLLGVADMAARHLVAVVASARVRHRQFAMLDALGHTAAWQELPHDGDVPVIADYIMAGKSPAPDRASVASVLDASDQAFARAVKAHMCSRVTAGARTAARTLWAVLSDPNFRPESLEPRDVADVALALHDVEVRDAVLSRLSPPLAQQGCPSNHGERNDAERQVAYELDVCDRVDGAACFRLAVLAAYVPRHEAAPVLTVVGYLAWQAGEGALANMAISAALEADSDYSLARLVDMALSSALRPPPSV